MRDDQIKIKPFEFMEVRHFSMLKKESEHTVVSFAAQIAADKEDEYMQLALGEVKAEVSVLQQMEEEALTAVLEEAKEDDVSEAAPLLEEAAESTPELQGLRVRGIADVVEGLQRMTATTTFAFSTTGGFAGGALPSTPSGSGAVERLQRGAEGELAKFTSGGFAGSALPGIPSGSAAQSLRRMEAEKRAALPALDGFTSGIAPVRRVPSPMDIVNALPLTRTLKEKGVTRVFDTLVAMKERGIFKKLEDKAPAEVAKTNEAAEAVHQEFVLLKGVVTELSVSVQNGVKVLSGVVKSSTCLMDITPHIRTWQDGDIAYGDMLDTILDAYADKTPAFIMSVENEPIQAFVLQYKETDWQFAKRMASHQNASLIPDDLSEGICFYYGLPKIGDEDVHEVETNSYGLQKRFVEYLSKKDGAVPDIREKDAIYYTVCLRDVFYVGEKVRLNGQELRVSRVESHLRGSEIYHHYLLKEENGFKVPRAYNAKAIGVSLRGTVLEPMKDVVKIYVSEDENQEGCKTRWFPYSTVYSSPDGTGWYCMPEPGDTVRLYIPGEDEREAYVISAVHLEVDKEDSKARSDPDRKSIKNKYGKEVLFTPGMLEMTNNNGMGVRITDGVGIEIFSDKQIELRAEEAIKIQSEKKEICIDASKEISLKQNHTQVTLQKDLVIEGAQTKVQ